MNYRPKRTIISEFIKFLWFRPLELLERAAPLRLSAFCCSCEYAETPFAFCAQCSRLTPPPKKGEITAPVVSVAAVWGQRLAWCRAGDGSSGQPCAVAP